MSLVPVWVRHRGVPEGVILGLAHHLPGLVARHLGCESEQLGPTDIKVQFDFGSVFDDASRGISFDFTVRIEARTFPDRADTIGDRAAAIGKGLEQFLPQGINFHIWASLSTVGEYERYSP